MRRIVAVLVIVVAAKAWAYRGRPVSDLRFDAQGRLIAQEAVTVEAGVGGYLAAWYEQGTVRASRIDTAGNYLDGEGIVLTETLHVRSIAIDGDGPYWLVVWAGDRVYARSVSRSGIPGAQTIVVSQSRMASVRWDGARYVVLENHDWVLSLTTLSVTGDVGNAQVLSLQHSSCDGSLNRYYQASLVRLGTRLLAVYLVQWSDGWTYIPLRCTGETYVSLLARYLDDIPLMARNGDEAFAVAANGTEAFRSDWIEESGLPSFAVAANSDEALDVWDSFGSFYSKDGSYESHFHLGVGRMKSSVAFARTEFVVASTLVETGTPTTIATARVKRGAGVTYEATMRRVTGESAGDSAVAGNATLPALIGFINSHPDYTDVPRAMLLFAGEIEGHSFAPAAPSNVCVTRDNDTATVTWKRVSDAMGIELDLELPDGTFRQTAVASAGATSARISLAGSDAVGVRIRAWNAAGLSAPSYSDISVAPTVSLRSTMRACAGLPATVSITLTGTPPFTVHWYDGVVQKNLYSTNATREVTLKDTTTLSIVKVEDRSCAINETPEKIRITVDPVVALTAQTHDLRIRSGESATLTVTASNATEYAWFEGPPGDTSHPVGLDSLKFTTPPLRHSTQYWARVSNRCGSVDSEGMNVLVAAKRRAVGR